MNSLDDPIKASVQRPFHAEEHTLSPPEMSAAELASFNADVQRIVAMLGELNSPAAKLAAHLGIPNAGGGIDGRPAEARATTPLPGAGAMKRSNPSTPSTQSSSKTWAMRRFS